MPDVDESFLVLLILVLFLSLSTYKRIKFI